MSTTNVLVVCRNKEMKEMIREALSELPVRITKELDGGKGVTDAMVEQPASLVIVDLFLPGTNGLEILKLLKKVNESAGFVMLTRLRSRSSIEKAFRYGALDVLQYPCDADTLRHTVAHRLENMGKPGALARDEAGADSTG